VLTGIGLAAAAALWTGLALAGLDVVFTLFPWAYLSLKLAGAAYLLYLAFNIWRTARATLNISTPPSSKSAVLSGILVNLSNPKSMLFASAVLVVIFPRDMTLFAKTMIVTNHFVVEVLAYSLFALALSTGRARDGYLRLKPLFDRIAALVLGALGLRLLLSK
jgi:threonine/homoserine/homoserine lactone efflux protein